MWDLASHISFRLTKDEGGRGRNTQAEFAEKKFRKRIKLGEYR